MPLVLSDLLRGNKCMEHTKIHVGIDSYFLFAGIFGRGVSQAAELARSFSSGKNSGPLLVAVPQ